MAEAGALVPAAASAAAAHHAAWFHELDAWTAYWDVYHPETHGRYYFGDGRAERGLLTRLLPRTSDPPLFVAWTRLARGAGSHADFLAHVRAPDVADAVREMDALVAVIFARHFGAANDPAVQADYLSGMFRFAIDALPPATERAARIPDGDRRKATAGRHALESDRLWFAWALQLESANALVGRDGDHAMRALMMAGVAMGCAASFAWRGHRRTPRVHRRAAATRDTLGAQGLRWASDFAAATAEVHALYRSDA